ncbi:MAG TPA: YafY family protein [Pseudomonadales bacterium]|nr:YafY family protein [Pseudomonadales bacterium]
MRPADRLFQIVLQLGRGRVVTARVLAERLRVSERTIYRDVRNLVDSGVPIEGEAGVGYVLRRGYQLPPLMFDEEELEALMFGVDVARAYGDPRLGDAAERILAKVEAVLPERLRPDPGARRIHVPPMRHDPRIDETMGLLREAIAGRVRVFVDYLDARGESSERIVNPLALSYWGGTWLLGAWCELRQEFRNFRLDRIVSARPLASAFADEPGRTLADYMLAMARRD